MNNIYIHLLLILTTLGTPLFVFAEDSPNNVPQKIYNITRQNFDLDYYINQSELWKQRLHSSQKDADAWLNYYTANKMIQLKGGPIAQTDLDQIAKEVQTTIPNSFEALYIQYWNAPNNRKKITDLEKAYQLRPDRYETYPEFIIHHEKSRKFNKIKEFCNKWIASGEYSSGILNWNYNVLMSLDKNAILLTFGDNDTHPIWLLQYTRNIRKDINILNVNMILDKEYQNTIFSELNIAEYAFSQSDFLTEQEYQRALIDHILIQRKEHSVYFGVGAPQQLIQPYESNLYLTGLSFKYSKKDIDNIAILKTNYEHLFMTDYLRVNLYHDISQSIVDLYNLNYLPSFLILRKHYESANNNQSLEQIEKLIIQVADAGGKGKAIRQYLGKSEEDAPLFETSVQISHRDIESMFTKASITVGGNQDIYPAITETSMEQYELFLTDLLKQKQYDKINICQIHPTDWKSYLPGNLKKLSDKELFNYGNPENKESPVQNISYEGANLYCQWLTQVYNNMDNRKKRFKKVLFRLPTEEEWLAATQNSDAPVDAPYSWFIYEENKEKRYKSPTNGRGCYLANFNVSTEPCNCPEDEKGFANDGLFFSGRVDSYFPNDLGLYNTIGNVAEMLAEEGKAKGGSWYHKPKESTRQATNTYAKPQPYIGFRVFMEVLEE
ncbi:MAG: formylglycine-generating enzyme family protein [Saprospiraceae bacterium]|nr:formylglycine-generating enzyme family protein [Saprospiraceae bacterium]